MTKVNEENSNFQTPSFTFVSIAVVELIGPPPHEAAKRKIEPVDFEDQINSLSQKSEKPE